jgi:hypothetical protein
MVPAFNRQDDEWVLGWVWLRPERRRHGLLLARWPDFLQKYGDFWIEHPLCEAMQAFVQKHARLDNVERSPSILRDSPLARQKAEHCRAVAVEVHRAFRSRSLLIVPATHEPVT